jgi:hypothetical protein
VDVGTIGPEGVAGLAAFLGEGANPFQMMGQVAGAHARLPMRAFLDACSV